MDKIKEFLSDKGYEFYEIDNVIEFNDERLHCMVVKKNDCYLVRNAIRCYFDRWANSGIEFSVSTEDEVIRYFSTPERCITDAVMELVETIAEEAGWENNYSKVDKMIEFLYKLVNQSKVEDEDKQMSIFKTDDGKELIVSCRCGCDNGIRMRIDKDLVEGVEDYEDYMWLTYQSSNWYKEQGGMFKCLAEKCKKIWTIIRNKDFYYSEVCMSKDDFEKFKEWINQVGE